MTQPGWWRVPRPRESAKASCIGQKRLASGVAARGETRGSVASGRTSQLEVLRPLFSLKQVPFRASWAVHLHHRHNPCSTNVDCLLCAGHYVHWDGPQGIPHDCGTGQTVSFRRQLRGKSQSLRVSLTASQSLTTSWAESLDVIWVVVQKERKQRWKERTGIQRLVQWIRRELRRVWK